MKLPKPPPPIGNLFKRDIDSFSKIYSTVKSPLHKGQYLHWDDIAHKTPPPGLTNEEYWFGIKMRRGSLLQPVPLLDKSGEPFVFFQPDPIPEDLHTIDMQAGGRVEMHSPLTTRETRDRYYVSSLIEEAITSSQIEGAAVTREVAKEMLRAGRKPRDRSERMILNNYNTMRRLGDLRDERLTPGLVFEIHRLITDGTLDNPDGAGRFRLAHERIEVGSEVDETVYHVPPDASELADRMEAMCEFANAQSSDRFIHPVLRAIILHFWLAYDHPFIDGNGRTARALFYWSMLRSRYFLFEFVSISQIIRKSLQQYYRAFLYTESDGNDLTYFLMYHLKVIKSAVAALHDYIQQKSADIREVERDVKSLEMFNHRQRALLSHAVRHPSFAYSIESHRTSHGVVHETARSDLVELAELGLLEKHQGPRKRLLFVVPTDLEHRLRTLPIRIEREV